MRYGRWFVSGNIVEGEDAVTSDNWNGGVQFRDSTGSDSGNAVTDRERLEALISRVRVSKPFAMQPVTTQTAKEAYQLVLEGSGATLPPRDPVDLRIIEQVRSGSVKFGTNGIIKTTEDVGGWPEYKGEPRRDLRPDGLPLWWKKKHSLNVSDSSLANKDLHGDGYTVLEKYLNGLDPTQKIDWSDPRVNSNTLAATSFHP